MFEEFMTIALDGLFVMLFGSIALVIPILAPKRIHEIEEAEARQRLRLLGILFDVGEPPLDVVDERDDYAPLRPCGRPDGEPRPASIHDAELPVLHAVCLLEEWADERLALVEPADVPCRLCGVGAKRRGFDQ